MKLYIWNVQICLIFLTFTACKKDTPAVTPLSTLNFVNATVNLGVVKANFTNTTTKGGSYQFYSQITTSVGYGANVIFPVLSDVGTPLTIAPVADTTMPAYSGSLNLANGGSYSLYLAGSVGSVDAILLRDTLPHYSDSVCGVRFINLSYNSNPIIAVQTISPATIDFSSLSYKQISEFKTYAAGVVNTSYSFQVRDAGTDSVLGAYTLTTPYFHNVTLAWIGQKGATGLNAPKIVRINNY